MPIKYARRTKPTGILQLIYTELNPKMESIPPQQLLSRQTEKEYLRQRRLL